MSKTKYVARLNGEIVGTRTTERAYTHAVICAQTSEANYFHGHGTNKEAPHIAAWCGRLELARKQVQRLAPYYKVVEIVPAELQPSNARTAKAFNDSGVFAPFKVVGKD